MRMIKGDVFIGLGILAILILFGSQLPRITPLARVYPLVLSFGLLICVLLLLAKTLRRPGEEKGGDKTHNDMKRILLYLVLILMYILSWELLGFLVSTCLFSLISMLFLGMRNRTALIAFPLLLTAVIYIIFVELIMIELPMGTVIENLW